MTTVGRYSNKKKKKEDLSTYDILDYYMGTLANEAGS